MKAFRNASTSVRSSNAAQTLGILNLESRGGQKFGERLTSFSDRTAAVFGFEAHFSVSVRPSEPLMSSAFDSNDFEKSDENDLHLKKDDVNDDSPGTRRALVEHRRAVGEAPSKVK